ncbi:transposable element Tcb2 transposase [Trichonephila clavipes]|nr:transposable element Tcb2 transposase [Trichonephila clavipes]
MANYRRLRLQWAHERRAWQADWHQVVFSYESCFNLWDHDDRSLPECVIERHSGLTPGVMVWGPTYVTSSLTCLVAGYVADVWNLVGRRLTRDPHPTASKDELLLHIQAMWNSLPQADIQNLFASMPRRIAALNAARGAYTKYRFRTLNIVFLL